MKEKVGTVFSIARENQPVTGCTISREVRGGENYIIYPEGDSMKVCW